MLRDENKVKAAFYLFFADYFRTLFSSYNNSERNKSRYGTIKLAYTKTIGKQNTVAIKSLKHITY